MVLSTHDLDFGEHAWHEEPPAELSFRVRNDGGMPLALSLSETDPGFDIGPDVGRSSYDILWDRVTQESVRCDGADGGSAPIEDMLVLDPECGIEVPVVFDPVGDGELDAALTVTNAFMEVGVGEDGLAIQARDPVRFRQVPRDRRPQDRQPARLDKSGLRRRPTRPA